MNDELIKAISDLLRNNITIEQIRNEMLAKGFTEDDIFLAIKAGENLAKGIRDKEEEMRNENVAL
jgi:hypothetical protein